MSGISVQRICTFGVALFVLLPLVPNAVGAQSPRTALASAKLGPDRLEEYSDLAAHWMQEYLRIDTTNPPGNEMRAATFFKKVLDEEGIENRVFEYQPGRANLWARIPHSSKVGKRPRKFFARPRDKRHNLLNWGVYSLTRRSFSERSTPLDEALPMKTK